MRISHISAKNFLSFREMSVKLTSGLNVIVGPNSAGKTNLSRAIYLIVQAVRASAAPNPGDEWSRLELEYSGMAHTVGEDFEVRIGVVFDDASEIALWREFFCAALTTMLVDDPSLRGRIDEAVRANLSDQATQLLETGNVIVRYAASNRQPWNVFYELENIPPDSTRRTPEEAHFTLYGHLMGILDGPPIITGEGDSISNNAQAALEIEGEIVASLDSRQRPIEFRDLLGFGGSEFIARSSGLSKESRSFTRLKELGGYDGKDVITPATVIKTLLSTILTTENVRLPIISEIQASDMAQELSVADGANVGKRLLQLKNGDIVSRGKFIKTRSNFERLTGRLLDVRQEFRPINEGPKLFVMPVVEEKYSTREYPLNRAGAGATEAAFLSLVLAEGGGPVLLDEPGTNLSPPAQRRLLTLVREFAKQSQVIMITHTSALLPVQVLENETLTRVHLSDGASEISTISQKVWSSARGVVQLSDVRQLVFSSGVILVEGPTEHEAITHWLLNPPSSYISLDESNVAVCTVGGDSGFGSYFDILDSLSIPWLAISDGTGLRPSGPLQKALKSRWQGSIDDTFESRKSAFESSNVHTLAKDFYTGDPQKRGEIEFFFHSYSPAAWAKVSGRSKIRKGYSFAQAVSCPQEILDLWKLACIKFRL